MLELTPPPRHGRWGTPRAEPPLPGTADKGGGPWEMGPPCPPPPPTPSPWSSFLLAL